MQILIDAGNSRLKWACDDGSRLHSHGVGLWADLDAPPPAWQQLTAPDAIVLCSVAAAATTQSVVEWCQALWTCPLRRIRSSAKRAGVHNGYPAPDQLGSDRWAALIGAHHHFRGEKCIVDAGSAITIDLLSADGIHHGGYIAPGYNGMLSALHHTTDLPQPAMRHPLTANQHLPAPATDTINGIGSGVTQALLGLIERSQRNFHNGQAQLLITGGDGHWLAPHLGTDAINVPDLVLQGLAVLAREPAL